MAGRGMADGSDLEEQRQEVDAHEPGRAYINVPSYFTDAGRPAVLVPTWHRPQITSGESHGSGGMSKWGRRHVPWRVFETGDWMIGRSPCLPATVLPSVTLSAHPGLHSPSSS